MCRFLVRHDLNLPPDGMDHLEEGGAYARLRDSAEPESPGSHRPSMSSPHVTRLSASRFSFRPETGLRTGAVVVDRTPDYWSRHLARGFLHGAPAVLIRGTLRQKPRTYGVNSQAGTDTRDWPRRYFAVVAFERPLAPSARPPPRPLPHSRRWARLAIAARFIGALACAASDPALAVRDTRDLHVVWFEDERAFVAWRDALTPSRQGAARCMSGAPDAPPGDTPGAGVPMEKFFDVTAANFAQVISDR